MSMNPMHQFEVYRIGPEIKLGGVNLSFTNASLFMTISSITILLLLFFGTKKKSLIPSKLQLVTEMSYAFTVTSHIIVTFVLASFIFIGVTIIGFIKHGIGYLKLFVPSGVPLVLMPLIVIIEIISYLSRPISLSVRLFANMMAGHTMMKVFGGFVISLGIVGGWLPLSFSVALTGLEILVAFLQAYVFAILTCIYLNDALNLHH